MTNTFDSDGTVEEWAENWDSPHIGRGPKTR